MIENLRNKFVENPESLKDFYNDLDKLIESKKDLNVFITYDKSFVDQQVEKLIEKAKNNEKLGKMFGVAVSVKDNINVKDLKMTCGSKMLEDYVSIYDATVIKKLKEEDCVIVGKVNMDEFAMGSSSETSYFGPTKNPVDTKLIPGGSSSGSAASIKAEMAVVSLGTDTGGSSRQPASCCNVVGFMPTYGSISRFGVQSMANTLDEVGILSNSVEDIMDTYNVIAGHDDNDMTTIQSEVNVQKKDYDFKGKKIAVVDLKKYSNDEIVIKEYQEILEILKKLGADLVEIDFEYLKYANALYNVIVTSEVSSNMSRFDGIRYGYLTDDYENTRDLFVKVRSEGFGEEVKRRIAMGTLYLASSNDQKVYKQGLKVRNLLSQEFKNIFKDFDFIATPTMTSLPYELDSRKDDPLAVYDSGIFNVIVNLSGLCAISIPYKSGISTSLQLIANSHDEENLLNAALAFERR